MPPAPRTKSSFEGSNAKRYSKMTGTWRIFSRDSRVCRRRWMRMQSAGIDLSAVAAAACRYLCIEKKKLPRPTIRVEIARARALVSYVATQILSISGSEVARRFNVDRSGEPKGKPRPGTAFSHQNDTKRTRTRNKSTLKQRPIHPLIFVNFSPSSQIY